MESALEADFSDIRVHVGHQAGAIGALAFTHGSTVYFAPGQYDPSTPHGRRLLAHELAHVVQQRSGRVRNPFGAGLAVVHDPALEAEAVRLSLRAVLPPAFSAQGGVQPALRPGPGGPALPRPVLPVRSGVLQLTNGGDGGGKDPNEERPRRKRKHTKSYEESQKEQEDRLRQYKAEEEKRKQDKKEKKRKFQEERRKIEVPREPKYSDSDNDARQIQRQAWLLIPTQEKSGEVSETSSVTVDPHEKEATTATGLFLVWAGGRFRRVKLCAMQRRRTESVERAKQLGYEMCDACPTGLHIHAEAWLFYSAVLLWGFSWKCLELGASQEICHHCKNMLDGMGVKYTIWYVASGKNWGDPWKKFVNSGHDAPESVDDVIKRYREAVTRLHRALSEQLPERTEPQPSQKSNLAPLPPAPPPAAPQAGQLPVQVDSRSSLSDLQRYVGRVIMVDAQTGHDDRGQMYIDIEHPAGIGKVWLWFYGRRLQPQQRIKLSISNSGKGPVAVDIGVLHLGNLQSTLAQLKPRPDGCRGSWTPGNYSGAITDGRRPAGHRPTSFIGLTSVLRKPGAA